MSEKQLIRKLRKITAVMIGIGVILLVGSGLLNASLGRVQLSRFSLSFGGVKYNRTTSFLELYKRADQVLYKVKHNCKGQFKIVEMKTE